MISRKKVEEQLRRQVETATELGLHLCKSITEDQYPMEDVEKLYGIKMGDDSLGKLVYNCWHSLMKLYIPAPQLSAEITHAFLTHRLPQYFEYRVREYFLVGFEAFASNTGGFCNYFRDMVECDLFKSIEFEDNENLYFHG